MQTSQYKSVTQKNIDAPSFTRLWRQLLFVPVLHNRWLDREAQKRLSTEVTQAEKGHRGEICLVIENHLPIATAYHMGCRRRALDLFSAYGVWDTEENTGVLVYVNVCEHRLEVIADRGINSHVSPTVWRAMCDKALAGMAKGEPEESLSQLLEEVGQLMRQYYHLDDDPEGNELPDAMVYIK